MTDTSSSERRLERSAGGNIALLQTERGSTSIDDSVVAKIAALAAREVNGVAALGGTLSGALGDVVGRIRGSAEHSTAGVGVEVGSRQAAVDISCQIQYPASIPQVAESVRQNVIDRIESMTGLEVVEVNIAVSDLVFPEEAEKPQGGGESRVE
jgi:uncharacterized alkaline shock family protein YloU